jgi:GNAT superfamily N-acetyltransferase
MPEMLGVPAAWLLLDGMACAFVVADGGLCGLFDVATAPAHRRQGLSRRLIGHAAAWGAAWGAGTFWLQVAAANAPALALYAGLSFAEQYRYAYWQQKDD